MGSEDEQAVRLLRGRGVEVVEVEGGEVTAAAVGDLLYKRGMLSAFWMLGGEAARAAVAGGCIQELSVYASLVEADELDDLSERFGMPMKVSVMSCDALQTNACILSVQVDAAPAVDA